MPPNHYFIIDWVCNVTTNVAQRASKNIARYPCVENIPKTYTQVARLFRWRRTLCPGTLAMPAWTRYRGCGIFFCRGKNIHTCARTSPIENPYQTRVPGTLRRTEANPIIQHLASTERNWTPLLNLLIPSRVPVRGNSNILFTISATTGTSDDAWSTFTDSVTRAKIYLPHRTCR